MKISSSPGLNIPPKSSPQAKKDFFLRASFGVIFNLWDKDIFISDNHDPFGNCIPVRVNQARDFDGQDFDDQDFDSRDFTK